MVPTYYAEVPVNGRLTAHCPALAGKRVTIIERKAKRSTNQNSRYWALLTVASRELGYDDVEELHEGVALKFLGLPSIAPGIFRRRRTPKLNTKEFAEYTDAVERFFRMDLGVDLSEWDAETDKIEGYGATD